MWALWQVARSGAEFGDDGMAPGKDGTCLYCPNLSFCQEITLAYADGALGAYSQSNHLSPVDNDFEPC